MHILFDLRTVDALPAADRIYLIALVDGLLPALGEGDRVTVLLAKGKPLLLPPIEHPAVAYVEAERAGRTSAGAAELMRLARRLRPNVYWSADPLLRPPLWPRRLKVVFAAEELLHFADPARFGRLERLWWRLTARPRLAAAHALVCPSHAQEVRLIAALGLHARRKTHVVPNGVHPIFRRHDEAEILAARRRWLVPQRYVLLVGRAEGRHNLGTPLRALAGNEEVSSATCVIVGDATPPPALRALIRDCHLEGMVRTIDADALPPADLSALYSGATVTFEPSTCADYRPTILQSMACGTPVICAASAVNEELFGNAALRVHPTDAAEWGKAFTALTLSSGLRERLVERGLACVAGRTWTATAKATMALARQLAKESAR